MATVYTVSKELREFVENGMKRNPFAVLSRLVYDGVYQEIIEGRLTVKDSIVVSQLAESLNLSRTPVKIAMEELLEQNMLEKREGNKLGVRRVSFAEGSLLFEARMAIETQSAYLAARRVTEEELRQMEKLLDWFRQIDAAQDAEQFVHCDRAFHELVVRASKNQFLVDTYACLKGHPCSGFGFKCCSCLTGICVIETESWRSWTITSVSMRRSHAICPWRRRTRFTGMWSECTEQYTW